MALPILEFIMPLFFQLLILFTDDAVRYAPTSLLICQSQIGLPICKWDDQSEIIFEVCSCIVLSHTLLLFKLMASTDISRIEC